MEQIDELKFVTILTGLADYYGKELSEGTIALYWQGLQQYDLKAVERAMWEHTQNPDNGQFMPKIADITRCLQGRTQDQAFMAWTKVDSAIKRVGTYQDVAFDDPIIHRVIMDMGGWIWLGHQTEEEWPFIAKRFESAYRGYRMRGETPDYPPVLTGIANAHNQQEGFATAPPTLIGDQGKAQMVLSGGTNKPMIEMRQMDSSMLRLVK
jgi:hypothetical protein